MEPLVLAPDLTVAVVLTRWPQTIPVFLRHRMACVGCPFARFESLVAATAAYGLPLDSFLSELRSSISGPMIDHCEGEHLVIAKVVGAAPLLADRLEAGQSVDRATLQGVVEFMRTFADKCHHGKEEELLFPLLASKGIPLQGCPVGALTAEHTRGRQLVKELADAAEAYASGDLVARETVVKSLRGIAALYPNHIWKEDYLLFPLTNKVLKPEEQQILYQEFEQVEERVGREVHHRLEQFAEQLAESTQNG